MTDALCDVPGCGEEAKMFGPGKRRCLPHVAWEPPNMLPPRMPDDLLVAAARKGLLRPESEPCSCEEAESLRAEVARLESLHDGVHALLDDALERIARTERVLECWPADGAFALRVLRGEVVR